MSKSSSVSLFWTLLNIAVGVVLAVGGIWALQGHGDFAASALKEVFTGDVLKIAVLAFGVIELLSGIFIILQLFVGDRMGSLGTVLKIIIVIVWAAAIVIADFIGGFLKPSFLPWIYELAMHLVVLCALLVTRD